MGSQYIWNKEAVSKGLNSIADCRADLLGHLTQVLNAYHHQNRSRKYYDILAGMWLEQFMHVIYAAWAQVQGLTPVQGEKPLLELATTPLEYSDLVVNSSNYHNNLKAAIQRAVAGAKPITGLRKTDDTITAGFFIKNRPVSSPLRVKCQLKKYFLREVLGKGTEVLICNPYIKCTIQDWIWALWKWRHWVRWDELDEYISVPVRYDHEWRYNCSREEGKSDGFLGILKCLLPLCVPTVFLEGYKDFYVQTLALNKPRPRMVYTANALHFHLTFKFLVAEWQEQGTIILCHQHGGGYGLEKIHVTEDYETRVTDRFYSWGWQGDNAHVMPLPVGIHRAKRSRHSRRICLTCVEYPRHVYRLHFQPMPGTIETMIHNTIDFVKGLSGHEDVLIRPQIASYDSCGMFDRLKQSFPEAKYDIGKKRPSQFKRYAQSRMVVHNYLGTSWLETLALNVPTICFFDPNTYEFREEAKPYIENLENVGILHRSGKEAARFINDNWEGIESWWHDQKVQKARSSFCTHYANFSPDWPRQWESEFKRVLSQNAGAM